MGWASPRPAPPSRRCRCHTGVGLLHVGSVGLSPQTWVPAVYLGPQALVAFLRLMSGRFDFPEEIK